MRALFTCTLFLSAFLLFLVQPMVARLVLPLLGGTPGVWNTCMVFFQAILLAGYAYAHAAPSWLGLRQHAIIHAVMLLLPLAVLPIAVPADWPAPDSNQPIVWLLGLLLVAVGLPFFAVSTSAPLLQRWFAASSDRFARDPYFLYAASNAGSLLALLSYPLLLEPTLRLSQQSRCWTAGYALLVVLTIACAVALRRFRPSPRLLVSLSPCPPITLLNRTRWLALAFVPSSLMLSVTTYLTTDIAAVPLLWVLPLSLYLLTFVLSFGRRPMSPAVFARWSPLVVLVVVVLMLTEATEPLLVIVGIHLLALWWIGMFCHGTLAAERPPAVRLTEFYLWLSFGGVLGGLFNGLVAPLVFNSIAEYPIILVLACLLLSVPVVRRDEERKARTSREPDAKQVPFARLNRWDMVLPVCIGLLVSALVVVRRLVHASSGPYAVGLVFGLPLIICYTFSPRPVRFGLAIAAILLAATQFEGVAGRNVYRTRSFFGTHRVTQETVSDQDYRVLLHGNTVHGKQSLEPAREREPLTYYHRGGPIGQVFAALKGDKRLQRVGLVGLGAGALACYGEPGQHWTFFEIDPAVIDIAQNQFTYCKTCPAELVFDLGDARLRLAASDDRFSLLIIDAFSSDAIPVHLLTREALQVYRSRLADNGLIAFHISNRYLNLLPVLAALARDANMICLSQEYFLKPGEQNLGIIRSHWVVLAPLRSAAAKITTDRRWQEVRSDARTPVWTDDFSNLLGVMEWR